SEQEARIVPHLKFGMDFDTDPTSLYSVKGIVILDQDGNRIIAKYFDKSVFGSVKEQKAFEKNLFSKTSRNSTSDIVLLDGVTCLYRSNVDLHFYVLGSSRENELILEALLTCLYDAISTVLRKQVEKKTLIDAMDTAMLIIDEICDEGIILETDSQAVVQRCNLKGDDISFSDQTFSQVGQTFIGAAREQLKWSLLK
ncbi:copz-1, partial [Pristionchus pacificus]